MSIRDWETVEKIQRTFKNVVVLSNICQNFDKNQRKIQKNHEGTSKSLKKCLRNLGKLWMNLCKFYEKLIKFCFCLSENFRNVW